MIDKRYLYTLAERQGITLSEEQLSQFDRYAEVLVEWNQKMNLTAITEPKEIVVKHFLDSILLLKYIDVPTGAKLADIGTGAGFPGIPLKIVRPDIQLTLIDSLNKRVKFLKEVLSQLEMEGEAIHLRAEEGGKALQYREQYDVVTARAVANLRELSEYCIPYVRTEGIFAPLKGADMAIEIEAAGKAIRACGGAVEEVYGYELPDGSHRTILCIKKISQTPPKYPRNRGQMLKKPL